MNRLLPLVWALGFVAGAAAMLLAVPVVATLSDAEAREYKPPHVLAAHGLANRADNIPAPQVTVEASRGGRVNAADNIGANPTPEPVHTPLRPHLYDYHGEAAHLEEKRQTAEHERQKAEHEAQVAAAEAARERTAASREVVGTRGAESSQGSSGGSWESVAACIRRIESSSNYGAVSASGRYRGAYQADVDFWLTYGGDPDYAGRHEQAPPAMQDAVAYRGWQARGLNPWPTPSRRCR